MLSAAIQHLSYLALIEMCMQADSFPPGKPRRLDKGFLFAAERLCRRNDNLTHRVSAGVMIAMNHPFTVCQKRFCGFAHCLRNKAPLFYGAGAAAAPGMKSHAKQSRGFHLPVNRLCAGAIRI